MNIIIFGRDFCSFKDCPIFLFFFLYYNVILYFIIVLHFNVHTYIIYLCDYIINTFLQNINITSSDFFYQEIASFQHINTSLSDNYPECVALTMV